VTEPGGLHKHQAPYLNIPSALLGDPALSFRAKGLLCYLLDKPEGWVPRYAVIAAEIPEGKTAIQHALRVLRACGYYVVLNQLSPDGLWVTETHIGDTANPEWIEKARRDFGE
jgi:hypothetical protein